MEGGGGRWRALGASGWVATRAARRMGYLADKGGDVVVEPLKLYTNPQTAPLNDSSMRRRGVPSSAARGCTEGGVD